MGDGLRHCYRKVLRPFEDASLYHGLQSPPLEDADFDAKPMVMLVGQYSTGKSTFIRYLLGEDFPGIRIGPEPTTDKFSVIMHGAEKGIVPGNALAVDPSMQFRPLTKVLESSIVANRSTKKQNKKNERLTGGKLKKLFALVVQYFERITITITPKNIYKWLTGMLTISHK